MLRGTQPIEITNGIRAYPLPGHTQGSVLFLADDIYCFSGDSFYWSRTTADIEVFEHVTWFSIQELAASLRQTVPQLRFEWLLPGHGDRKRLPAPEMAERMQLLAQRASLLAPRNIDFTATHY